MSSSISAFTHSQPCSHHLLGWMSQDLKFAPVLQVRARCSLFVELGEKRVERQVATKLLPVADAGPATFAQPIMVKHKSRAFVQGSFTSAQRMSTAVIIGRASTHKGICRADADRGEDFFISEE